MKIDDIMKIDVSSTVNDDFKPVTVLTIVIDMENIQDLKALGKAGEKIAQKLAERFLEAAGY